MGTMLLGYFMQQGDRPWLALAAVGVLRVQMSSCAHRLQSTPFPVKVFWHIMAHGRGDWQHVVRDQLKTICTSKLLETATITATVVGGELGDGLLSDPRIEVYQGGATSRYEYPTLEKLQDYCEATPDARVIYFHNKGASYSRWSFKGFYVARWRKLLEHFVLHLHRDVLLRALNESSVAGPLYRETPHPHFSGNFFAARCDYVNTFAEIEISRPEQSVLGRVLDRQ